MLFLIALVLAVGVGVLGAGLWAIVSELTAANEIAHRSQVLQAARIEAMKGGGRERLRARLEHIAERKAAKA